MKIIDNYLPESEYLKIKEILESFNFPWFYFNGKVMPNNKLFDFGFSHTFYIHNKPNSEFLNILDPIINKIEPLSLIRIKANLNPISKDLIEFKEHTDQQFKCKAAIYYVNDNNGYTMIGDKKVESKGNRIVMFNANTKHYGTNSTNCNNRVVINFNYI
tara:strand:+ start:54 stop:530 length:477 start_codon:yes stop_codon:yes gene_type:complete